jgi:lipopolysaccharide biosynthesis glycosyltransferase
MTLNIACTIDEAYAQHCGVMLCSLFRNNRDIRFRVFVVTDGLGEASSEKLRRLACDWRQQLEFLRVDHRLLQSAPVFGHVSAATYFRILLPQILPADVDKVLFLDSDVIVRGPIADLYEQAIEGYTHAAIENPIWDEDKKHPATLGIPDGSRYFNAGVLVFNLRRWREDHISEQVFEYVNANADKLQFWDQDALNATLHGRWLQCHPTWNAVAAFFEERSAAELAVSEEDLLLVKSNPRIVHFTGTVKPWSFYCDHPFKAEYFKYLAFTPWRGYRAYDRPSVARQARLLAGRLAPGIVKQGYRKLAAAWRPSAVGSPNS